MMLTKTQTIYFATLLVSGLTTILLIGFLVGIILYGIQ